MDNNGYYKKFEIKRTDGSLIADDEEHFVLRLDSDRAARESALLYARITENSQLEEDLCEMYMERGWPYDPECGFHYINCECCGKRASEIDPADDKIGEILFDPGVPASYDDPGDPDLTYFLCIRCRNRLVELNKRANGL